MIKNIDNKSFEKEVLKSKELVIVDFFATWCMPCKMLGEQLDKIEEENEKLNIFRVNVDDEEDLAIKYEVVAVPTMVFFKDGKVVNTSEGYIDKKDILKLIEKYS